MKFYVAGWMPHGRPDRWRPFGVNTHDTKRWHGQAIQFDDEMTAAKKCIRKYGEWLKRGVYDYATIVVEIDV